jgi:hypothetical protein
MWTSIIQDIDNEKIKAQKINFLKNKLKWISHLIIQTKHSKLTTTYGYNDMKDIIKSLEKVGDDISNQLQEVLE